MRLFGEALAEQRICDGEADVGHPERPDEFFPVYALCTRGWRFLGLFSFATKVA
jgi:hypothetical protein